MIENDFGKLYVGISNDARERVYTHNTNRGALFTKGKAKFKLVFKEEYDTLAEARQREIQIKKWRREKKEKLNGLYQKGLPTKMK